MIYKEFRTGRKEEGDFLKRAVEYFKTHTHSNQKFYYEKEICFIAFKTAVGGGEHEIIICRLDDQTHPSIYYGII